MIVIIAELLSIVAINLTTAVTHQLPLAQCLEVQHQYGKALLVAIPAVCFIAPIAEETVFRGFLFGWMRKIMPLWSAAVTSGLIFSLLHFQPQLLVPLWIVGIILAYVYHYSRSLIPGMLTHGIFNLIGIIMILKTTC